MLKGRNGASRGGGELDGRDRTGAMRVAVDGERCQGHNRCIAVAPELFDLDELGFAHVLGDGAVPAHLEQAARSAVQNCPEEAIAVVEQAGADA